MEKRSRSKLIRRLLTHITLIMFNGSMMPIYPEGPGSLKNLAKKKEP